MSNSVTSTASSEMQCFHPLSVINPSRSDWRVQVKVLRNYLCYYHSMMRGQLWLILSDERGVRINVHVDEDYVQHFGRVLREGEWKIIQNFDVSDNDCPVPVRHAYKITISGSTKVYGSPVISRSLFTVFSPFDEVLSGVDCDNFMVELIGKVCKVGELTNMQTDQVYTVGNIGLISTNPCELDAYRLTFRLRNSSGKEIRCLAMQQTALDIAHDLARPGIENEVCVLRWWKVHEYRTGCFGVSSEDSVSQLLINP